MRERDPHDNNMNTVKVSRKLSFEERVRISSPPFYMGGEKMGKTLKPD